MTLPRLRCTQRNKPFCQCSLRRLPAYLLARRNEALAVDAESRGRGVALACNGHKAAQRFRGFVFNMIRDTCSWCLPTAPSANPPYQVFCHLLPDSALAHSPSYSITPSAARSALKVRPLKVTLMTPRPAASSPLATRSASDTGLRPCPLPALRPPLPPAAAAGSGSSFMSAAVDLGGEGRRGAYEAQV